MAALCVYTLRKIKCFVCRVMMSYEILLMYSRVFSILIDRTANGVKTEEPHLVTDRIAFRQGRRFLHAYLGRYHILRHA